VAGRPRDESTTPAWGFFARAFERTAIPSGRQKAGSLSGRRVGPCLGPVRKSARAEADCAAPMGRGATATLERLVARLGQLGAMVPRFEDALDIPKGGAAGTCPRSCSVGAPSCRPVLSVPPGGVLRPVRRNSTGCKTALNFLSFCVTPRPRRPSRTRPGPAPTPLPDADHPIADRPSEATVPVANRAELPILQPLRTVPG
jgi:hypothetical protein